MGDATLSPKLLATATPAHAEPPATSDEVRMEAAALAVATLAGDTLDPVAWEEVLKHNPSNHLALSKLADIARMQGRHLEAAGYLERLLAVGMPPSDGAGASSEPAGLGGPRSQGEVHAALGHCFLAVSHEESDLSGILRRMQESHDAYKLALAQIVQGEDPDLWYGIGLLYDRYASLMKPSAQKSECEAAAIKAFDAVLTIEPRHERRDEVLFRLGLLLKAQNNRTRALECFTAISENPSRPVDALDVWFQIGHVHESVGPPSPQLAQQKPARRGTCLRHRKI
jgi:tetratricopeptide (TPR) repeat protein